MTDRIREIISTVLIASLVLTSAMEALSPVGVWAVSWGGPGWPKQVPLDATALPIGPAVSQDQLGRIWVAWHQKTLGGSGLTDIFFKYCNLGFCSESPPVWTNQFQVTTDPNMDNNAFITALSNGTMMIFWSSNRTGNNELFYRPYLSVSPVTGPVQLTFNPLSDSGVSAIQDRKGRIWAAWTRLDSSRLCGSTNCSDIYYKYYDGSTWSSDFPVPMASDSVFNERAPSLLQGKDGRVWVAYASNEGQQGSLELFYTSTNGDLEPLPSTGIPVNTWAAERMLTSDNRDDDNPVLVRARDGTVFLFHDHDDGNQQDVRVISSPDNGATWTGAANIAATTANERFSSAAQMSDNMIWVFYNKQGLTSSEIWYTVSSPIEDVHDVGISGLAASPSFLRQGQTLTISVTVTNYGDFPENAQLTVKLNNTVVTTMPLSLLDGETRVVEVSWQSTWGRYVLTATLQTVAGETSPNQGDSSWSDGLVRVTPPGDVDFDGDVDIIDAATLGFAFGSTPGSPQWNPEADLDGNGVVDILDAAQLAFYFGKTV